MEKTKGVVTFYDAKKDFGFIKQHDGGKDIYFNSSSCVDQMPQKGDEVLVNTKSTDQGLQAGKLEIIEDEITVFLKNNVLNLAEADYDKFCDTVKEYAFKLRDNDLTTSQIRKVYSRIMNTENPRDLKRLRPQFAYTAGREEAPGVKDFMDLLDYLAKEMAEDKKKELKNFKTFMEAAVAYRKYAGKDK